MYGLASKNLSGKGRDQAIAAALECLGHARDVEFFSDEKQVNLLTAEADLEFVRAAVIFEDFRKSLAESEKQ